MQEREPLSDRGLLLASMFVAVVISGIGILGRQQVPAHMATVQPVAMTAAADQSKQQCLPKNETNQANIHTPCVDGCHYTLSAGGSPLSATLTSTSQYSDGTKNPGTIKLLYGGSSFGSVTCKGGPGSTLGDAKGPSFPDGLPSGFDNLTATIVQPAAPAATAPALYSTQTNQPTAVAQTQTQTQLSPDQTNGQTGTTPTQISSDVASGCGPLAPGFACGGAGVGIYSPCNVVESGYTLAPGETPCANPSIVSPGSGLDSPGGALAPVAGLPASYDGPPAGYEDLGTTPASTLANGGSVVSNSVAFGGTVSPADEGHFVNIEGSLAVSGTDPYDDFYNSSAAPITPQAPTVAQNQTLAVQSGVLGGLLSGTDWTSKALCTVAAAPAGLLLIDPLAFVTAGCDLLGSQ